MSCVALEIYEADGEPSPPATAGKEYSGKFVLRVGKELHKDLAIKALRCGESLNSYCVDVLRRVAPRYPGRGGARGMGE